MNYEQELRQIFVEEQEKFRQIRTAASVGQLTEEQFWAPFRFDIRVVLTSGAVTVIRVKSITDASIVGYLKLEATDGFEDAPQRINPIHIVAWRFIL